MNFETLAAWGNWTNEKDLGDRVLVLACPGGRDELHRYREPQRYFMVPSHEYAGRSWKRGFVIAPEHEALTDAQAAGILKRIYKPYPVIKVNP